jgi:photosystem II stability/assembly factor-like uncharacterized protein
MRKSLRAAGLLSFGLGATLALAQSYPESLYSGLKWRLVGPFRGGRVEAVTGVQGDPNVYYFGAVAGGIWKTTNGGLTWQPIFDSEGVASIGALAVDPTDPKVVYAGTGERALRDDISFGEGVYKSQDAGKTWTNIGLRDSRQIARIRINPKDPNTIFVAALGHAFGPNTERGVFRSHDGGKTWEKVLYVDENTGATDLVFDPNDPNVLFAAMYEARRSDWSMLSGGPGSGLYKSVDGGTTWKRIEGHGLPAGILGRIGVAVSKADSNRVYAMIEAKTNALYRSDDGGVNWQMMNDDPLWVRPWYGNDIFTDPKDKDRIYLLDLGDSVSIDGGRSFKSLPIPHSDNHDLWIDPENPLRMINGNDGGATISTDGGTSWTPLDNQPTGQFYHIIADNDFNYKLYSSQQDDGSVAILSRTDGAAITPADWHAVGGGECGYILPDPRNSALVFAGDHNGRFTRYDARNGQIQDIAPWLGARAQPAANLKHRFQWTSPMALSPFDPNVLYLGAEVLFKTTNGGASWTIVSPDLTRNDKSKQQSQPGPLTPDNTSAEYYDTIFAVAESPVQKDLIWAGSDDGLIHLTTDGGKHWTDVTPKQLPPFTRVNLIEPSHFDAGTAYAAASRHRSDDFAPLIFKTTDFGKNWTPLTHGLPANAYVHSVRQDPERKDLLFAGTEKGIFVSFDDGGNWQSLKLNLPPAPVYDTVVHGSDLAVATHGRSIWILDDITPLRQAKPSIADAEVHLYTPKLAYRVHAGGRGQGGGSNVGQNPPAGAILDYYLKSAPSAPITLTITDGHGQVVRTFTSAKSTGGKSEGREESRAMSLPAAVGLNRFVWNLQGRGPAPLPGLFIMEMERGAGPLVVPGTYQVELAVDGQKYTAPLEVKLDPRVHVSQTDLEKQLDFAVKIQGRINELHTAIGEMRVTNSKLEAAARADASQAAAAAAMQHQITEIEGRITQLQSTNMPASLVYPIMLDAKYADLLNVVEGADSAPLAQAHEMFADYENQREELLADWHALQPKAAALQGKQ